MTHPYTDTRNRNLCDTCDRWRGSKDHATIEFGRDTLCRYCGTIHAVGASHSTAEGVARAIEGQDLVTEAMVVWSDLAREWIDALPRGTVFGADQLVEAIGLPPSRNAVGAAFGAASRKGVITSVGLSLSVRKDRHAGTNRRWVKE